MAFENFTQHLKLKEVPTIPENLNWIIENRRYSQAMLKIGTWTYEIGRDVINYSDEYYRILEINPSESGDNAESFFRYIRPEERERVRHSWGLSLSGEPQELVHAIVTGYGNLKYVRSMTRTVRDENGQPLKVIGVIQDITETKLKEDRLEELGENLNLGQRVAGIGSWKYNAARKEIFWSDEIYRIYDLKPDEFGGTVLEIIDFIHPEDRHVLEEMTRKRLNHQRFDLECRICLKDKTLKYVRLVGEPIKNPNGHTDLVGTIQDITELMQKKQELEQIEQRNRLLIAESGIVYQTINAEGIITYTSETAHKVIDYDPDIMLGRSVYEFFSPLAADTLRQLIAASQNDPLLIQTGTIEFNGTKGQPLFLEVHVQNLLEHPGIGGLVLDYRDVTLRITLQQQVEKLANYDPVTNLPRAHQFRIALAERCAAVTQKNSSLVVVMLDVLGFKEINTALGRDVGKQLMVQIMLRLKWLLGKETLMSRYSEDQFALVIEGLINLSAYDARVEEIIAAFQGSFKIDLYEFDLHVNAGVSVFPLAEAADQASESEPGSDSLVTTTCNPAEQLVHFANVALIWARKEGRNRHRFFAPELNIENYKQLQLRHDLRLALKREQFMVFYQPIVRIQTNQIIGLEALIRWNHPDWGIVSPDEFIFLAEETGAIVEIGKWLLRRVCEDLNYWQIKGFDPIYVSVNFSGIQFYERNFVKNILDVLKEHDVEPGYLIVELTESLLIENAEKAVRDIQLLKQAGIMVALDDFGTGYSSLAYLKQFAVDIIKMDAVFLKSIKSDPTTTLIARSIIELSHELNIRLVAEGVENWDQLHFLKDNNTYAGQGYLYAKPMPLIKINDLLEVGSCRPVYSAHTAHSRADRRMTFRIEFYKLLKSDLRIRKIGEKEMKVGRSKVLLKDISPGGLCFVSNIQFPLERLFLLEFTTTLIGRELTVWGHPVWFEEMGNNLFRYGVRFEMDDAELEDVLAVVFELQIRMKKNLTFADGSFTDLTAAAYFEQQSGTANINRFDFSQYRRQRF